MSRQLLGRGLRSLGRVEVSGEALVSKSPITFLGFLDPETGVILDAGHPLVGQCVAGKVLIFPRGVGSTVGPYVLLNLKRNGCAPLAIINRESDQGTVAGASVTGIPLAYAFEHDPTGLIESGARITLTLDDGKASLLLPGKR